MFDGLLTYLTSPPIKFYGLLPPLIMLAGLLGVRRDRRVVLLWSCGILDVIALGLTTEAQVRYIFFGTALLVIIGTDRVRRMIEARPPRQQRALAVLAIAAIVAGWVHVTAGSLRNPAARVASTRDRMVAAAAIRSDARGGSCQLIAVRSAQIEWYGGCTSLESSLPEALARGEVVYIVNPDGADLMPERHHPVFDAPGVHVVRIDPGGTPARP